MKGVEVDSFDTEPEIETPEVIAKTKQIHKEVGTGAEPANAAEKERKPEKRRTQTTRSKLKGQGTTSATRWEPELV